MSRLRKASIDLARESRLGAGRQLVLSPVRERQRRAMEMGTLVAAVDAAIGRDDSDTGEYYLASTFAVIWATIGYIVWVVLVITARVIRALWILVTWPFRKDR